MPVSNLTLFNTLLGPLSTDAAVSAYTLSVSQSPSHGGLASDGTGAGYISRRAPAWAQYMVTAGTSGTNGTFPMDYSTANFYDRANAGYIMYAMGGYVNETLLAQANAIALAYRTALEIGNGFGVDPHNQFTRGIALHYAATGDVASRAMVAKVADYVLGIPYTNGYARSTGRLWVEDIQANGQWWDQRIWSRVGEPIMQAYVIGAPSVGNASFPAGGNNYFVRAQEWLNKILNNSGHSADGLWRDGSAQKMLTGYSTPYPNLGDDTYDPNTIYVRPFYTGLVLYALMDYYRFIEQDSRIVPAILAACENLWTGTRIPGCNNLFYPGPDGAGNYNSMGYLEAPSTSGYPGSPGPELSIGVGAPDLNGLVMAPHAFLYQQTGDATWKTRFDLLLDGSKQSYAYEPTNPYPKQFEETYSYTGNMWPMILGTPASGGGTMAPTEARDAVNVVGRVGTSIRLNWV